MHIIYNNNPELIVVGAGPGDPELITLKAYRILKEAPVILYDNLANTALLDWAHPDCEKIYVGKLPYGAYTPQETIHTLIKEKAFAAGRVIRLKGGDPFIFGRGFEEIVFARQHGIAVSYIPGVSSMQAAGLSAIPLTHRHVSESIWIITGTKKDGDLSADLALAMKSKATVVIYMGMKKLKEIAALYEAAGLGAMPAAIIRQASLPEEKMARGVVRQLPELASIHQLTHPSIIVIGPVVALGMDIKMQAISHPADANGLQQLKVI
ncbi:uroporphyrinogen-III C-methyltransferase [Flavitalea sp. BT771]|uniref:uroporphyrinogen-III C-methyltransferase n=1 Tax=Flavitalea sp. BT771 TaxID=3063329 RepID=UPI0026E448B2|nr:uroporphyrinogen-III C-methyltransferase [Flavitalea sp. BT771]MDO6431227.1 uroporphyrinogen-III C-methyltransferase [Flavitalea sp. BT771]MDV6220134.1 uroporphyrinogen-III C-methyltransferase [Flavitalea sp. BT771]